MIGTGERAGTTSPRRLVRCEGCGRTTLGVPGPCACGGELRPSVTGPPRPAPATPPAHGAGPPHGAVGTRPAPVPPPAGDAPPGEIAFLAPPPAAPRSASPHPGAGGVPTARADRFLVPPPTGAVAARPAGGGAFPAPAPGSRVPPPPGAGWQSGAPPATPPSVAPPVAWPDAAGNAQDGLWARHRKTVAAGLAFVAVLAFKVGLRYELRHMFGGSDSAASAPRFQGPLGASWSPGGPVTVHVPPVEGGAPRVRVYRDGVPVAEVPLGPDGGSMIDRPHAATVHYTVIAYGPSGRTAEQSIDVGL